MESYGSFMDQEPSPVPLLKCVAEYDDSHSYEIDEGAIFETDGRIEIPRCGAKLSKSHKILKIFLLMRNGKLIIQIF